MKCKNDSFRYDSQSYILKILLPSAILYGKIKEKKRIIFYQIFNTKRLLNLFNLYLFIEALNRILHFWCIFLLSIIQSKKLSKLEYTCKIFKLDFLENKNVLFNITF